MFCLSTYVLVPEIDLSCFYCKQVVTVPVLSPVNVKIKISVVLKLSLFSWNNKVYNLYNAIHQNKKHQNESNQTHQADQN